MDDPAQVLRDLQPEHDYFIGIDSDGCAFDTMEIKHKECFIPNIIKHWGLQPVSKYAREAAEFINLYSRWRGVNRFPALTLTFDLLKDRKEVIRREAVIPEAASLRTWIDEESKLGNPALKAAVERTGDPVLKQALAWSEAVNSMIADMVENVPPFPFLRESLEKIAQKADAVVISSTPHEALSREWNEHGIDAFVREIAGQEMGKKSQHIAMAAGGKYPPEKILMIGDAPGDMKAARANGALFYPIIPGREDASWERFHCEALDRFLAGTYGGAYEDALVKEFLDGLPETPPWKR